MRQSIFTHKGVNYRRVPATKKSIEKLFGDEKNKTINGFFVGSNVADYHFFGGWYLASTFEVNNPQELTTKFNSFNFHLEPKFGKYPALYIKQ